MQGEYGRGVSSLRDAVWRNLTLLLMALALAVTFIGFHAQDDITRGVYPAVAGRAALYLGAAFGIPALLQPTRIRLHRATPWITGGLGFIVVFIELVLWWTNRVGLGYQWIQSIHLIASPDSFGDLQLPLSWIACANRGIDPYVGPLDGCAIATMNYGPGLLWWRPLGHLVGLTQVLGVSAVVISSLALVWLSRRSRGRGRLLLLFAVVAPAWTMLLDHGNFDQLIIWLAILLVVLAHRMGSDRLLPWVVAAVPIWVLGSWKYYPFAMIIAFVPVLRIRRGWTLIVGFLAAAAAYLLLNWSTVTLDMGSHADMTGGVGRSTLAAFIGGQAQADKDLAWPDLLILTLLGCAFAWGWTSTRALGHARSRRLQPLAVLAAAGAGPVLAAVTVLGFGFPYKAALLLVAAPLLSTLGGTKEPALWRATTSFLILIGLGMTIEWNPLLGSLAVNVGAAFVLGLAIRILSSPWLRSAPAALSA